MQMRLVLKFCFVLTAPVGAYLSLASREEIRLQVQIYMTHSAVESFRRNIHTGLILCVCVCERERECVLML